MIYCFWYVEKDLAVIRGSTAWGRGLGGSFSRGDPRPAIVIPEKLFNNFIIIFLNNEITYHKYHRH